MSSEKLPVVVELIFDKLKHVRTHFLTLNSLSLSCLVELTFTSFYKKRLSNFWHFSGNLRTKSYEKLPIIFLKFF